MRAQELCGLAPYLPKRQRRDVLTEALAVAQAIPDMLDRQRALGFNIRAISQELPGQALSAALELERPHSRVALVAQIASNLSEKQRDAAIRQVFEDAIKIEEPSSRASALKALAPHLGDDLLPRAITAALEIPDTADRCQVLVALLPYTWGPQHTRVVDSTLAAAIEVHSYPDRAGLLVEVLPLLSGTIFFEVLSDLTKCWFRVSRPMVLQQMERLIPLLAQVGGPAAVWGTYVAVRDVSEWWP